MKKKYGFTLLEVLIAVVLVTTVVMALIDYHINIQKSALNQVFDKQSTLIFESLHRQLQVGSNVSLPSSLSNQGWSVQDVSSNIVITSSDGKQSNLKSHKLTLSTDTGFSVETTDWSAP